MDTIAGLETIMDTIGNMSDGDYYIDGLDATLVWIFHLVCLVFRLQGMHIDELYCYFKIQFYFPVWITN